MSSGRRIKLINIKLFDVLYVGQGQAAVVDFANGSNPFEYIITAGLGPCVGVVLANNENTKVLLAHMDSDSDVKAYSLAKWFHRIMGRKKYRICANCFSINQSVKNQAKSNDKLKIKSNHSNSPAILCQALHNNCNGFKPDKVQPNAHICYSFLNNKIIQRIKEVQFARSIAPYWMAPVELCEIVQTFIPTEPNIWTGHVRNSKPSDSTRFDPYGYLTNEGYTKLSNPPKCESNIPHVQIYNIKFQNESQEAADGDDDLTPKLIHDNNESS